MKSRATSRLAFVVFVLTISIYGGASGTAWAAGLLANWTLDVGAPGTAVGNGATIADLTGNGYDASVVCDGSDTLTSVAGVIGNGLTFNGVPGTPGWTNADYVSANYEVPNGQGGYTTLGGSNVETISFWMSIPSRTGNYHYALILPGDWSLGVYANVVAPGLWFNSRGGSWHSDAYTEDQYGNKGFYARQDGTGFVANTWELVTMVYYGGNAYTAESATDLYVNGRYVTTGPDLGGFSNGAIPLPEATANLQIGFYGTEGDSCASWYGSLNDVGIWKTALSGSHDVTTLEATSEATTGSAGEIAALYNTPMYNNHTGALSQYGVSAMDKLFTLYESAGATPMGVTTANGTLGWKYVPSGLSVGSGYAGQLAGGEYVIQLDANGGGVESLLPGDANGDGTVDINDLTIVLAHYGQTGTSWASGEFTGDGTVDINDLTVVLANYGGSYGAAGRPAAVPEPSALALLAAGLIGLFACARRKRN
jgi:hypothetical protein